MANFQKRSVDWCIQRAFWHAFRKAAPAQGTPKYNASLAIADSMQKAWADEEGIEWSSLYQTVTLNTKVSTATIYALDPAIDHIDKRDGNPILITAAAGGDPKRFPVINPSQLYEWRFRNAFAQEGRNLILSKAFSSTDALIDGTIQVPAYTFVPDISLPNDTVVVDRPMWLVYMIAAELVRNDVVKRPEYNNILTLAQQVMDKMLDANEGQREELSMPWRPSGESWI